MQATGFSARLNANVRSQDDRTRAAIDLLHIGGAVAACIVCFAVKLLAAGAGAQGVVLVGKRIAELTVQSTRYSVFYLAN